ncbi:MAG TPA: gfo/Idh/MocA family oxidoreductase, partial [Gemmataceae bacterium]|nr:gfo/Idh/MocA family oxidoreductase [Gemmataceae bacterium]
VGNIFHCTEGVMVVPSYSQAVAFDLDGKKIKEWKGGEDHFGNFVKAVRSRKVEDLNADIEEGHLSSALCHLGNISYRLGTLAPLSAQVKEFASDKEAAETLERMRQHLADNKVPPDRTQCRVGRKLAIDPKAERFVGDKEADKMLTREYRKGFEVPAKIG